MLISHRFSVVGCGFALGIVASTSAFAQSAQNCRPEISIIGSSWITKDLALKSAVAAWRRTVVAKHGGEVWGEYEKNAKNKAERCFGASFGFTRCEVRAQPCEELSPANTTTTLTCERGKDDMDRCDPTIKWVQSRLNAKGTTPQLRVDGIPGESTSQTHKAVRKFKRDNNLGDNDTIDEKVFAALRS